MSEHIGKRYGRLTILGEAPKKHDRTAVLARCECGKEKVIVLSRIVTGVTRSCGCGSKAARDAYKRRGGGLVSL